MRQLDFNELHQKFADYSSEIKYADFKDLNVKIDQLIAFLHDQEIAARVLERIEEDFYELKARMLVDKRQRNARFVADFLKTIRTREMQGAFGYFAIMEKFKIDPKYSEHYLQSIRDWSYNGKDFYEYQKRFNTYFFEPFTELFEWYLNESKTVSNEDYFSSNTQEQIFAQLDEMKSMLTKLGFGQEIVFKEIDDVKKLTKKLNKKNWDEVIKGKFIDLGLSGIISLETAKKVIEFLTGDGMKLLN